jgi:aconitate hydratase
MANGEVGGVTTHYPSGELLPIFDAARRYAADSVPLVVFGGREYGAGSSRDWAAKGTKLLGVRAVIVRSFERIHRSNLAGMGVLPCEFADADTDSASLNLRGDETVAIKGLDAGVSPQMRAELRIRYADGKEASAPLIVRIDTPAEAAYFKRGGILPFVLEELR